MGGIYSERIYLECLLSLGFIHCATGGGDSRSAVPQRQRRCWTAFQDAEVSSGKVDFFPM
jgi:hypothetical protein